ncbi:EcsC family protein [Bacillus sp. 31A1R]|uniref:EcsC family protein n=1 Tax=Robertmurraya mangrovi TaxID=3098077 RepID=A0ABU5ISU3_9BACI|nr:EcsC family protein [Bacillus sp. 31A1R]MDZ5470214.1 EcsC family protein [Bacillus sp. 31A1R]
MNEYELHAYKEVEDWKRNLLKKPRLINRLSKKAQIKINEMIPEKAHHIVTESIRKMVQATLVGSNFITKKEERSGATLADRDKLLQEKMNIYRKTAAVEGAGTGAGGILLALADFPLLLSIKMKFLFEAATVYGYDTDEYEERLFILHIFKLAFSSEEKRKETYYIIENWEEHKKQLADMDWREFQQEYRDYIDFVKMLQLIPGLGAIVGAYANYNLLDHLGEVAMNCYRLRLLKTSPKAF